MTNTELIQVIKAEIERLKDENNNIRCDSNKAYCQGYGDAFVDLLPFLDTLESEKPMNLDELKVELDIWRHDHFHGARDGHFSGEYLERTSQLDLANHFAQWGAEHLKK